MYKLIATQIRYVSEDEAFDHLAKGIVIQAIEDYRRALHNKHLTQYKKTKNNRKALERFFRSDWFELLCDWDGETLIKTIQEQEGINNDQIN